VDTFFWVNVATDAIQALVIIGSGSLAVWLLLRYYQTRKRFVAQPSVEEKDQGQKMILPLRLQACERLILFLERISPETLVMRIQSPGMTVQQLHASLIRTIREEFEYNLSQQLYISATSWEKVRSAKEEIITLINSVTSGIPDNASSHELVKAILKASVEKDSSPVMIAIESIRDQINP
jgi:hypothetical protein